MRARLLLRSEWARLEGTELAAVVAAAGDGDDLRIVVVEDDAGALVGAWALFPVWHVEGLWVAAEHRGRGAVARRLLDGMRHLWRMVGARAVVTASCSEDVTQLLKHVGASALPGTHYVLKV